MFYSFNYNINGKDLQNVDLDQLCSFNLLTDIRLYLTLKISAHSNCGLTKGDFMNTQKTDLKPESKKRKIGIYIGMGVAIGAGIGAATGNIAVGVGVGVAVGAGIGVLKRKLSS
jgi:hypothetical protein